MSWDCSERSEGNLFFFLCRRVHPTVGFCLPTLHLGCLNLVRSPGGFSWFHHLLVSRTVSSIPHLCVRDMERKEYISGTRMRWLCSPTWTASPRVGCFKMQKVKISRWGSPKIGYYTKLSHCKRNWDFSCKIVAARNFFRFNGDFGRFQWGNIQNSEFAYYASKSGKCIKQTPTPPFWWDVGVKKWSQFFYSGTWSPIFGHLKMGFGVPKSKNWDHFFTPTSPQNGGVGVCFIHLPLLDA